MRNGHMPSSRMQPIVTSKDGMALRQRGNGNLADGVLKQKVPKSWGLPMFCS
jgi:hypothetical protein